MKYSQRYKLSAQQLSWAKIWVNHIIEYNQWRPCTAPPYGYYVYLNLDD